MGCNPEDLPEAMNDRETWRERVRDIRASRTTWWWWYLSKVINGEALLWTALFCLLIQLHKLGYIELKTLTIWYSWLIDHCLRKFIFLNKSKRTFSSGMKKSQEVPKLLFWLKSEINQNSCMILTRKQTSRLEVFYFLTKKILYKIVM